MDKQSNGEAMEQQVDFSEYGPLAPIAEDIVRDQHYTRERIRVIEADERLSDEYRTHAVRMYQAFVEQLDTELAGLKRLLK